MRTVRTRGFHQGIAIGLGALWLAACSAGGVDDPAPGAASAAARKQRHACASGVPQALSALRASIDPSQALKSLGQAERARLANGLAYFGADPMSLDVTPGIRGAVGSASGRFLHFDASPKLPAKPSRARARAVFGPKGVGRRLLGLCAGDRLALESSFPRADGAERFVFTQRHLGVRVWDATVSVDLDAQGRITAIGSTAVPGITSRPGLSIPAKVAQVQPRVAEIERVVAYRFPLTGDDDDRLAWRVLLVANAISITT